MHTTDFTAQPTCVEANILSTESGDATTLDAVACDGRSLDTASLDAVSPQDKRTRQTRKKARREAYGSGSCAPCMVPLRDSSGTLVLDRNGVPKKVQERDRFGRPVWLVCISFGMEVVMGDDGNMRRRQRKVQKRVHGTLDDARNMARQLREEYSHLDRTAMSMTFSGACEAWLASMRNANTCCNAKLRDYATMLRRTSEQLGNVQISSIRSQELENALTGVKVRYGLSQRCHREMFMLVKRVFSFCIDRELTTNNPCRNLNVPRITEEVDRRSLTPDECERLRASLDRDELAAYEAIEARELRREQWGRPAVRSKVFGLSTISGLTAVRLMLATGMRRGEVLGLTWENVDITARQITVRQSLNAQMTLKSPKTRRGVRTISIDADTAAHLARLKEMQAEALRHVSAECSGGGGVGGGRSGALAKPREQTEKTPVCCNCEGDLLDPTRCARWWREYRQTIGFPDLRMHELRHTQATMLLGRGIGVKDVQARLGHASASLTLDVYGHAIPANDRKAAAIMEAVCASASA